MSEREYESLVRVAQLPQRGMITVRGSLASSKLKSAVTAVARVDYPAQGQCRFVEERGIAWMSPDELLVMVPHTEVQGAVRQLTTALAGSHALVADVSDAREVFSVEGAACRDVMAKVTPADLRPGLFGPGDFRRSHLAQVAGAFWMRDATSFEIICFRSVADYVWALLCTSAEESGAVGHLG